jgi:ribosomal RNA-processing protein 17
MSNNYKLREERRKELEDHVDAVNNLLKEARIPGYNEDDTSEGEGWNGIEDEIPIEPIDHEAEYIDEDRYTTVTVEAVDVTKEGLQNVEDEDDLDAKEEERKKKYQNAAEMEDESNKKKIWPKKEKKKKFRYESKAERKVTRGKQKAGNKAKADARRGND